MSSTIEDKPEKLVSIDKADQGIAGKLIKLLTMAHKGSSEAEMQVAMAKAQELALRHFIDLATVDVNSLGKIKESKEPIVEESFKVAKGEMRRPPSHKFICYILGDHYDVKILQNGSTIWIIGRQSSVIFAKHAYKFLHRSFTRIWRDYKWLSDAPMNERASVYYGIWRGLATKLKAQADEVRQDELERVAKERGADLGMLNDNLQLAIVSEKEEVEAEMKRRHPIITYARIDARTNVHSHDAQQYGYSRGEELEVRNALEASNDTTKLEGDEDDE